MVKEMTSIEQAYEILFVVLLIILSVMFLICLIRAVMGPRVADRIVAINMMGTMVSVAIAVLGVMYQEGYLVDICMIYAMISFLAVVIVTKVYMGVYLEKQEKEKRGNGVDSV